ncbi:hypothetical protein D3C76_1121960 [compost metagenome]
MSITSVVPSTLAVRVTDSGSATQGAVHSAVKLPLASVVTDTSLPSVSFHLPLVLFRFTTAFATGEWVSSLTTPTTVRSSPPVTFSLSVVNSSEAIVAEPLHFHFAYSVRSPKTVSWAKSQGCE